MKTFDKVFNHYDNFIKLFNLNKMDEIKAVLDLDGNETIVDIGGGTGKLGNHLSEDCHTIYILDESEKMLSKVMEKEKIVTVVGDALDTPFHSNSIDIVIVSDMLHHVKKQQKLIEEIYRILKKDGKILIMEFEKNHIKTRLLRIFEGILFGKLYFLSSKEVVDLIDDKFSISKFIHQKYYFLIKGEKQC